MKKSSTQLVAIDQVERIIYQVRGERVILDADLAKLYGVSSKRLNEQVKRNLSRFPEDFRFVLSLQELAHLKSQFATSSAQHGGRRKAVSVFTEHGAIMAANVLNSPAAIAMSVHVVRAFVKIRRIEARHKDLAQELKDLKLQLKANFSEYDKHFRTVFAAIDQLIAPLERKKQRRIGFE